MRKLKTLLLFNKKRGVLEERGKTSSTPKNKDATSWPQTV